MSIQEAESKVNDSLFYDLVIEEVDTLSKQNVAADYRLCKALAACYELQEYLANRIAQTGTERDEFL